MSGLALADALLAAPATGEALTRTARDSCSRFGEVLDAAGRAFAESDQAVEDADRVDGADVAEAGEPMCMLPASAVLLMAPTPGDAGTTVPQEVTVVETTEASIADAEIVGSTGEDAGRVPSAVDVAPSPSEVAEATASSAASATVTAAVAAIAASAPAGGGESPDAGRDAVAVDARRASLQAVPGALAPAGGSVIAAVPTPSESAATSTTLSPTDAASTARPTSGSIVSASPTVAPESSPATTPILATSAASAAAPATVADDGPASPLSSPVAAAASPAAPSVAAVPADAPEPLPAAARAVAAQVSPVVVSIAQRPSGSHQLTMTVNPDSLGPVTVRAHIGQGGDVRVELIGATDAGRDALRAIVTDLRRDLAAAMPHATLSIAQGAGADAGADRGAPSFADAGGDQGSTGRGTHRETASRAAVVDTASTEPTRTPATTASTSGSGLDILA